jgi:hypothetical protein
MFGKLIRIKIKASRLCVFASKNQKEMNGLIWFRNDLRTIDNHSLYNACRENEKVIGIYCLDPRHFETTQYGFKKTEAYYDFGITIYLLN